MGAVNHKKKFIWIWIPKNAGHFIYSHPTISSSDYSHWGGHYSFLEIADDLKIDGSDYFKFCFSRNPYSRLVSAFHHFRKAHNFNEYDNFEDFILNNFIGEDGSLSISNSKTYKSTYRRKTKYGEEYNDHFRLQSDFVKDENGDICIDFVGSVENIMNDFSFVCNKLGIPMIRNQILNPSNHGGYEKYYDGPNKRRKIEIVNELYSEDFKNFGYEFL